MPRETKITVNTRVYTVFYVDDPPERQEAVRFFLRNADDFFPAMDLPPEVYALPIDSANAFLKANPIQETYKFLRIVPTNPIEDADLHRLQHLPEIREFWLISNKITDAGVRYIRHLDQLEGLVLYSDQVTDACFDTIREIHTLRRLDLQRSPRLSRVAFDRTVHELGLREFWPPHKPFIKTPPTDT